MQYWFSLLSWEREQKLVAHFLFYTLEKQYCKVFLHVLPVNEYILHDLPIIAMNFSMILPTEISEINSWFFVASFNMDSFILLCTYLFFILLNWFLFFRNIMKKISFCILRTAMKMFMVVKHKWVLWYLQSNY